MANGLRRPVLLIPNRLIVTAAALILLLAGGAAMATDGVIEINQAKVMARGGFPFTISQSGSYRLTSNLYTPDVNTTAIKVNANDVTIDLNGFSIIGPAKPGAPRASGIGIDATNHAVITIQNGEVAGMGSDGINTGHSSRIEEVRLLNNRGSGIVCSDGCEISHNISNNNGNTGIALNGMGIISSNVIQFNSATGIYSSTNSVVVDNTANDNGAHGIYVGAGVTVRGNAVGANGNGLNCFGAAAGYADNVFVNNTGGNVVNVGAGVCVNLGQNLCDTTVCP